VYRKSNQVVVDGVNIKFKNIRNKEDTVEKKPKSYPVHVSKVSLIDPEKKVATRISFGFLKDKGDKVRIAKKSGAIIPKPNRDELARAVRAKGREMGPKDTPANQVM
jgi:large subunit ribosomal protein L24